MKDRLTKKRIYVDYEAIIKLLDLNYEFTAYLFRKSAKISMRRLAAAFCKTKRVNLERCSFLINKENLKSYYDLVNFVNGDLKQIEEYCYEL